MHSLKDNKYMYLVDAIRGTSGYSPELITLEVGSRGPIHPTGFDHLQDYLSAPTKEWDNMLLEVTRTVIIESYKLETTRPLPLTSTLYVHVSYSRVVLCIIGIAMVCPH